MRKYFPIKKLKYLLFSIFLSGIVIPVFPNFFQSADSVLVTKKSLSAEDLIRGERLFFGLAYLENKSINCAACHNVAASDTLNWNPDALEISEKYLNKSAVDLNKTLLRPSGKKLMQVHKDFQLTPEDIVMIKGYMDQLADQGLKRHKPIITDLLLFIIAFLLFLIAVSDLIIFKRLKYKWINYLLLLSAATFIVYTLVYESVAVGRSPDYSPDQPIKFSHAVHAGQNKTDCLYCHSFAPISKSAGIPPENVCMNCHLMVRSGTRSGTWEISKILSAYENLKPVEWIKVYNLPDHVFFSHAQHVGAGGVKCQECHGTVEEMDVIKQVPDLSMGWCLDCHQNKEVQFLGNDFYSQYKDLSEKIRNGTIDSVTVDMIGGRECMKCHY